MRHSLVLFVGLVSVLGFALDASAVSRKKCKRTCGATIQACVDQGTKRRKCKRTVIKDCRKNGLAVCQPPGPGDTYHVATTGTDDAACGGTAAPCRTIQFVVDQLIPLGGAGTIKVAAGTYGDLAVCPTGAAPNQAVVCILNKRITLLGGYATTDWDTPNSDPLVTILDGQSTGRAVRIQRTGEQEPAATLEMDGFTVQNGLAQGRSTGTIHETYAFGGGVFSEHGAVTLRDVVFRNNRVVGGTLTQPEGGRSAGGGLAMTNDSWSAASGTATLEHVTFEANESQGGGGADQGGDAHGGALFTHWVSVVGNDLMFVDNVAVAGGTSGAGYTGVEKSDALGGAVSIEENSTVDFSNVRASGNSATGGAAANGEAGGAFGGAFFVELAALTLTDATIVDNTAEGGAGENQTQGGSLAEGGGIHTGSSTLVLDRVLVVRNTARAGSGTVNGGAVGGGGVSLTFGDSATVDKPFTITNSVIASNVVTVGSGTLVGGGGAGLWIQASSGTINHTTIADNVLGDDRLLGGGATISTLTGWDAHATISNSIFANHTTPAFDPSSYGDSALYVAQNAVADVTRVLFANNVHDSNDGISGGFNLPPGTFNTTGIVTAPDAGFVSPGNPNNDYHLVSTSAARDQATGSTLTLDLDGEARPSGPVPDLGADEFY